MVIGTAMLIRDSGQLIGLNCIKGRGITMDGGKVEEGETFREAAIRECLEETGLKIFRAKLVFHGFSTFQGKSYCYCYEAEAWHSWQLAEMLGKNHGSGEVVTRPYSDFLKSKYGAFYDVLFQSLGIIE